MPKTALASSAAIVAVSGARESKMSQDNDAGIGAGDHHDHDPADGAVVHRAAIKATQRYRSAAYVLFVGFGRAIGETMIVLMVSGNASIVSWNLFDSARTMTATIAAELAETGLAASTTVSCSCWACCLCGDAPFPTYSEYWHNHENGKLEVLMNAKACARLKAPASRSARFFHQSDWAG